jgi:hypothetical protein
MTSVRATRLAHETESLAFVDIDRDAIDSLHHTLDAIGAEEFVEWTTTTEIEVHFQISDRQQR